MLITHAGTWFPSAHEEHLWMKYNECNGNKTSPVTHYPGLWSDLMETNQIEIVFNHT